MKNLDKMKQSLIYSIQQMTMSEYRQLNDFLCELYDFNSDSVINKAAIFTCKDCKNIYGKCCDKIDECNERFERYSNSQDNL